MKSEKGSEVREVFQFRFLFFPVPCLRVLASVLLAASEITNKEKFQVASVGPVQ